MRLKGLLQDLNSHTGARTPEQKKDEQKKISAAVELIKRVEVSFRCLFGGVGCSGGGVGGGADREEKRCLSLSILLLLAPQQAEVREPAELEKFFQKYPKANTRATLRLKKNGEEERKDEGSRGRGRQRWQRERGRQHAGRKRRRSDSEDDDIRRKRHRNDSEEGSSELGAEELTDE
jgi:hypothetical protein